MPRIPRLKPQFRKAPVPVKVVKRRRRGKFPVSKKFRKIAYEISKLTLEKDEQGFADAEKLVGQVNGSLANAVQPGHWEYSIAPVPSQGDSGTQRTGDKITVTGIYAEVQFVSQPNNLQGSRGKIIIASPRLSMTKSQATAMSTYGIETLLNPNPYILQQSSVNVYDTTCSYNLDYKKNWKIHRVVNFKVPPKQTTGQKMVKTVKAGLKFPMGHMVSFAPGTTNIIEGDIRVFILFENGNTGSALTNGTYGLTTNATGVPVKDTMSGWTMNYLFKSYFMG